MPRRISERAPGGRHLLSRRRLLSAGAGALAGAALGACAAPRPEPASAPPAPPPASGALGGRSFPQPPELRSAAGALEAELRVALAEVPAAAEGGAVFARAYNGSVPGPTLRVRPGDRLDLELINDLPSEPPFCEGRWDRPHRPHGFDVTNLHTHGLHVSPASRYPGGGSEPRRPGERPALASDDVFVRVAPGGRQSYRIWLPAFHAPGTYWYHAHKHGSAALQVASGLVGALIVEEPPGAEIAPGARETLWVVHELVGRKGAEIYTLNPPTPWFYVNGASQPTLAMRPGEVQRWRLVNATGTPAGYGEFKLLDAAGAAQPMHLVAVDGITFYGKPPQPKTAWIVPPGGRADFLVRPTAPGSYRLVKDTVRDAPQTVRQELAFVEVGGPPADGALPARLPDARPPHLEPILRARPRPAHVRFRIRRSEAGAPSACGLPPHAFEINEERYRPQALDHRLRLGAVEEWELTNGSTSLHPFHIHVNPFQVVDGPDHLIDPAGPDAPDNWIWRDTVGIPPGTPEAPGSVKIRSRFLTYPGRYVLHCHFLVHEDLGMMQNVRVEGAGAGPGEPVEG